METLASAAISDGRLNDAESIYAKLFQIFDKVLTEESGQLQLLTNNLTTISLMTNDIEQISQSDRDTEQVADSDEENILISGDTTTLLDDCVLQ